LLKGKGQARTIQSGGPEFRKSFDELRFRAKVVVAKFFHHRS
jgi:hypothetical protein